MPKLNDIVKDRDNKKFVKKSYRPWDLGGDSNIISQDLGESIVNPLSLVNGANTSSLNGEQRIAPPISKETQTGSTLGNNKETNKQQKDNNQVTIEYQLDNGQETHQITNREQLDITLDPTTIYHKLMKLSGIQKNILNFVVDFCTIRNTLETGPIETSTIVMYAQSSVGAIKISLKRLIDKGFITRNKGKAAKGGYINLSITSEIYDAVILQRKESINISNSTDLINSIRYQIDNKDLYNSSSYIKNNTTKTNDIPQEWEKIDFDSLGHIGFTKTQIKQLVEKNEPEIVQQSINHFAFGIDHNPKFKKYDDPLNVLMGVLRKGQGWIEKDYRSPKEIAQQKLLESKKAELERIQKLEESAYKLALSTWQQNLTSEEIEIIAPVKKNTGQIMPQSAKLSLHFKEKIWSEIKHEYILD